MSSRASLLEHVIQPKHGDLSADLARNRILGHPRLGTIRRGRPLLDSFL
jgi:hypothetical protein